MELDLTNQIKSVSTLSDSMRFFSKSLIALERGGSEKNCQKKTVIIGRNVH